jgi:hypothetical protein
MVCIATNHLSERGASILRNEGWIVKRVEFVDNPGTGTMKGGFPQRFWGVYSKLNVWNLVDYKKVRERGIRGWEEGCRKKERSGTRRPRRRRRRPRTATSYPPYTASLPTLLPHSLHLPQHYANASHNPRPPQVIYLDSDTIVARNIDELFRCPGFCSVVRHSERFNSGIMVLEPSSSVFQDMLRKIQDTPSYTGGDQGFLNEYYAGLLESPMFDPRDEVPAGAKMMRLRTGYNGDVGLFILNANRWMIAPEDVKVIHFTLGPFKPWNWWTPFVVTPTSQWDAMRDRLPRATGGLHHGETHYQKFARVVLVPFPPLLLALVYLAAAAARRRSSRAGGAQGGQGLPTQTPSAHK